MDQKGVAACFFLLIMRDLLGLVILYANSRTGIVGLPLIPLMGRIGCGWCLLSLHTSGKVPGWQVGAAMAFVGSIYPSFVPLIPVGPIGILLSIGGAVGLAEYLKLPTVRARAGLPPIEVTRAQEHAQLAAPLFAGQRPR